MERREWREGKGVKGARKCKCVRACVPASVACVCTVYVEEKRSTRAANRETERPTSTATKGSKGKRGREGACACA